jgi:aldose 1-epimerase
MGDPLGSGRRPGLDPAPAVPGPDGLLSVAGGPIEIELLPAVGGRLHRLRAFGQDLLRTPDDLADHTRDTFSWGGYVMAPWCNRIEAAPTAVGGELVDLPANFPDGTAIHGQVYAVPWRVGDDGPLRVRGGGDGWPWPYETTIQASIAGATLTIEQTLTNLGSGPMPGGLGIHPWFRGPLEIRVPAERVLTSNSDPDAPIEPVSGFLDLRELRRMPDDLDAAWLDPADPAVELAWPDLGIRATIRARSEAGVCVVAASPRALGAVAIEPQTHLPQGLRRYLRGEPGGLHAIAPGATLRLVIKLEFARA